MDHDAGDFAPTKGMRVIGSDDQHIGDIDAVENAYVIVQHGLFPQDHYIPMSAITSQDDDAVYLDITKDEALERGLGNPMVAFGETSSGEPGAYASPDTDSLSKAPMPSEDRVTAGAGEAPPPPEMTMESTDEAIIAADEEAREHDRHDHQTIELHQEEATATTRPVERGPVRIRKEVVEERQTFEVPVVEEEVIATRRRVDKDVPDPDAVFTEEHMEIPIRGQKVDIETHAHVVEEVDIDKTAHQHIERVTETVRHEEARIDGDGIEVEEDRPDGTPST